MRRRSFTLSAVLATAAAVLTPTPAQAAVQCGLIVPTKVVIDQKAEQRAYWLTSGCWDNQADHANWEYSVPSGFSDYFNFTAEDLAGGNGRDFGFTWYDDGIKGRWVLTPTGAAQADGDPLSQNSAVTYVKYGADLATTVTRTSTRLTWSATATQWSGRVEANVVRPGVTVGLFHQVKTGAAWTFVKSVKTSSTGKATVSVSSPKSGTYRLVVGETPTVWAAYSRAVEGRA